MQNKHDGFNGNLQQFSSSSSDISRENQDGVPSRIPFLLYSQLGEVMQSTQDGSNRRLLKVSSIT